MNASIRKGKDRLFKGVKGFQVLENECIWMKAGVVNFRRCDNEFDCNSCPFDKGMRRAMEIGRDTPSREAAPKWVEHLKQTYQGHSRPCRHALTGRVDAPKICSMNYECYHCAFDQMLDEMDLSVDTDVPGFTLASGYRMADGYYYHMGHSWTRFEHGGRARVGFDDFFVKVFGPASQLTLPPIGEYIKQNQVGWTFGLGDHRAAVLSPLTGTVLAVNPNVIEHPEIPYEAPYREGWLMIVEPDMPKRNLKGLYFGKQSFDWMEREGQRLLHLLGPEYKRLAASGGVPIGDVFGRFPQIGWNTLVREFLRTDKK